MGDGEQLNRVAHRPHGRVRGGKLATMGNPVVHLDLIGLDLAQPRESHDPAGNLIGIAAAE